MVCNLPEWLLDRGTQPPLDFRRGEEPGKAIGSPREQRWDSQQGWHKSHSSSCQKEQEIGEQEKGLQQATREVDPDTPILDLHACKTRLRVSRRTHTSKPWPHTAS